jgi:signal recognition particle subunit SRP72
MFRIKSTSTYSIPINDFRSVDAATRAIALNNQLSLEPVENPFETHRLHDQALKSFISSKPFIAQSRLFSANSLLISSQVHKPINSRIKKYQELYPFDISASLIRLYRDLPGVSDPLFSKKLAALCHRDETDVAAALLLIQHECQQGSIQSAATTLERLLHALKEKLDLKYAPGLVSLAAVLLPKVEKEDKATSLMMEAKDYWSHKRNAVHHVLVRNLFQGVQLGSLRNDATLARLNQLLTLQSSSAHTQEMEAMIKEHETYLKDHPNDISTHAVLAALYASTSETADQHTRVLPPISTLTNSIDVAQLESQGIPSTALPMPRKQTSKSRPKKRRLRGNATIDISKKPDPERWLPLRERSYYKPAKNKKRRTGGATQGGAMDSETMSRTGSEHVERKTQSSGGGGGGKKKKKTRR